MKTFLSSTAFAILSLSTRCHADQCAIGSTEIGGNWFCQPVEAIRYSNVGTAGSYKQITSMSSDGKCKSTTKHFSGPLAPLDEEVSLHFRGPLKLKQFAAYSPATTKQFHHGASSETNHKDVHRQMHLRSKANIHTETSALGQSHQTAPSLKDAREFGSAAEKSTVSLNSAPESGTIGKFTEYKRISYYHASLQSVENVVFLGNHGGQGSGVFDFKYGASLAYANRKGTGGAISPQVLADTTIPSDSEVIVMSGQKCSSGSCGYVRLGSVAYHGFPKGGGADKIFLLEFSMPRDNKIGFNADMPAIWMLNAQIPRTLQYGDGNCSCWSSGCGEFDIAETLASGSMYLKSTFHTNTPGGDSDYILRPTSGSLKLAVIFDSQDASAHIQVLPQTYDFPSSLPVKEIQQLCSNTASSRVSHFHLASQKSHV